MQCPGCDQTLSPIEWNGYRVDACLEGCQGIWFDWCELESVAEEPDLTGFIRENFQAPPDNADLRQSRTHNRRCPADKEPLKAYLLSRSCQVVLDICPQCKGVWTDAGELEAYGDYLSKLPRNPWGGRTQLLSQVSKLVVAEPVAKASSAGLPSAGAQKQTTGMIEGLFYSLKCFIPQIPR